MSGALGVAAVTHYYNPGEPVLDDISLKVEPGEFLTLLGPSGCGKTTLLRLMAGFLTPTSGSIHLHGEDVTDLPPYKRRVNLVFQRPALFPHMDVYDNLAFGLGLAKVPKAEVHERVREALAMVRLDGFAHRRTGELSGGEAQRIALARALINRPEVLLLDEPLSALDLRVRLEMEVELRRVHRETGASFVYVTHDQHEALALSDRIAVLDQGRIAQLDTPDTVYQRPASEATARFVGDANVLPVSIGDGGGSISLAGRTFPGPGATPTMGADGWLVLRQEDVRIQPADGSAGERLSGTVRHVGFRGAGYLYEVEVGGLSELLKVETPAAAANPFGVGEEVSIGWDAAAVRLLPRDASEVREASYRTYHPYSHRPDRRRTAGRLQRRT